MVVSTRDSIDFSSHDKHLSKISLSLSLSLSRSLSLILPLSLSFSFPIYMYNITRDDLSQSYTLGLWLVC